MRCLQHQLRNSSKLTASHLRISLFLTIDSVVWEQYYSRTCKQVDTEALQDTEKYSSTVCNERTRTMRNVSELYMEIINFVDIRQYFAKACR